MHKLHFQCYITTQIIILSTFSSILDIIKHHLHCILKDYYLLICKLIFKIPIRHTTVIYIFVLEFDKRLISIDIFLREIKPVDKVYHVRTN